MYKITGTEVYPVSAPIKLKTRNRAGGEETENDYYVIETRIYNEGNMLKCEYTLGKQTDYDTTRKDKRSSNRGENSTYCKNR